MVDAANRPMTVIRCPAGPRRRNASFRSMTTGHSVRDVKHIPIEEKDGDVRGLSLLRRHPGPARLRPDGHGRIPRLGKQGRQGRISRPAGVRPRSRRRARFREGEGSRGAAEGAAWRSRTEDLPAAVRRKGIHVVVPLDASKDWPTVKSFADRFSRAIAEAEPEMFTANIRKVQRKGRIFLDWLRNQRGATAVMPFSARAREGAPVSAPVAWEELDRYRRRQSFHHPRRRRAARSRGIEVACGLGQGEASLAGCIGCHAPSARPRSSPPHRRRSSPDGAPKRAA